MLHRPVKIQHGGAFYLETDGRRRDRVNYSELRTMRLPGKFMLAVSPFHSLQVAIFIHQPNILIGYESINLRLEKGKLERVDISY